MGQLMVFPLRFWNIDQVLRTKLIVV